MQAVLAPGHIHLEPTARAQPPHRAGRPALRQGRQQVQFARVGLQQQLQQRRAHAKAAVAAAGYSSFYTLPEFTDGRTSGTFLDLPQKAGND